MRLTKPVPTMQLGSIRAVFSDEMKARAEMEAAAKGLLAIIDKTKREKASDLTTIQNPPRFRKGNT